MAPFCPGGGKEECVSRDDYSVSTIRDAAQMFFQTCKTETADFQPQPPPNMKPYLPPQAQFALAHAASQGRTVQVFPQQAPPFDISTTPVLAGCGLQQYLPPYQNCGETSEDLFAMFIFKVITKQSVTLFSLLGGECVLSRCS